MRVRLARTRDAENIIKLSEGKALLDEEKVYSMIDNKEIYVAVDFSANILGCVFGDNMFINENAHEDNIEEELKKYI